MCVRPALVATYEGGEPLLLERLVSVVDYVELSPDSISMATTRGLILNPEILTELRGVLRGTEFVVHGVGLSIASAEGYSEAYVALLEDLVSQLPVIWHSEHLGFTTVEGEHLGTMLPPPRTREALDLISLRIRALHERFRIPFGLEHIVRLLPDYPGEYSEAEFLNQLAKDSGCDLVLDIYNLECDRENVGLDVDRFLRELDLSRVREIHLAGGIRERGFRLDVHSRLVADSTLELAGTVLPHTPNLRAVTFEFLKEAIPYLGHDAISGELRRVRETLLDGHAR